MTTVDLFGGPGGWAVAVDALGLDEIGVEWDPGACETRRAAGWRVVRADVAALDPARFVADHGVDVDGLIASPPCPLYSAAGGKQGRLGFGIMAAAIREMPTSSPAEVIAAARRLLAVELCPVVAESRPDLDDFALPLPGVPTRVEAEAERMAREASLVLEPLRWALALRPRWLALEQVPPVLVLWEAMAEALGRVGYQTATGVLNAADYGVPQTRRRAILVARLGDDPVAMPAPTHDRDAAPGLERWVPMGQALGWKGDGWWVDRPATTLMGDPRCFSPGGHIANDGRDNSKMVGRSENAIRLELAQALVLQGFPAGYPVRGCQTEQFQQIGDAFPPPLARHVIRAARGEC